MDQLFSETQLAEEENYESETIEHDSDQSFIVDDDLTLSPSPGQLSPNRPGDLDDDYDFLFGSEGVGEAEDKEHDRVRRRVKDLERLLSVRAGDYDEFEASKDEILHTIKDLSHQFRHRQALESEILSLFSGLVIREHLTHSHATNANNTNHLLHKTTSILPDEIGGVDRPESATGRRESVDVADNASEASDDLRSKKMNKFMKRLIRQTFKDRVPEGRFGRYSRPVLGASVDLGERSSVIVSVDSEALANLRDINTLLHRERRGDYEDLDGVPLYKYPRCASVYIFSQNFISSAISPLCSILSRGSVSDEIDSDALINELIYFLYQITQAPTENWFRYWTSSRQAYLDINAELANKLGFRGGSVSEVIERLKINPSDKGSVGCEVYRELKYRIRIIEDYVGGLKRVRKALENGEIWSLIGEFRLKLEHFRQNNFTTARQTEALAELRQRQDSLSQERDELLKEDVEDEDESVVLSRLKKDRKLEQQRKLRVREIRKELYEVTTKITEINREVDDARSKSELHIQTVRILISQVLTIFSNTTLLLIFNDVGLLTIIRQELLQLFQSVHKAMVLHHRQLDASGDGLKESGYDYIPSYLTQAERSNLWEYMRLIYTIFLSFHNQHHHTVINTADLDADDGCVNEVKYKIEMYRLNPKLYNKYNDQLYNFKIGNVQQNRTKYNYFFQFRFFLPTNSMNLSSMYELKGIGENKEGMETLLNELNLLIGVVNHQDQVVNEPYSLLHLLLLCYYDLNRDVSEEYYEPCDKLIILYIKTFISQYFHYNHKVIGHTHDLQAKLKELSSLLVKSNPVITNVLINYLNQTSKKFNYFNNLITTQLLSFIHFDLKLINSWASGAVDEYKKVGKSMFVNYIKNNLRLILYNILRNFKLIYNHRMFIESLKILLKMEEVIEKYVQIEFEPMSYSFHSIGLDDDDDFDFDEEQDDHSRDYEYSSKKVVVVNRFNIFNSRNREKRIKNDLINNGRIIYNTLVLFLTSNNVSNENVLMLYLKRIKYTYFYDFKYMLIIHKILTNDDRCFDREVISTEFDFGGMNVGGRKRQFLFSIIENFFDNWLLYDNDMLVLELFYNKNVSSTRNMSITNIINKMFTTCTSTDFSGPELYKNDEVLNQLLTSFDLDIVSLVNTAMGEDLGTSVERGKLSEKDEKVILQYYSRFKYMEFDDLTRYISELLNISSKQIHNFLSQHTSSQTTDLQTLVNDLSKTDPDVLNELYNNLTEAYEMHKLSGKSVIDFMEPMALTEEMKQTEQYQQLMQMLNISNGQIVVSSKLELKLKQLESILNSAQVNTIQEKVDVYNVTSIDIIKLLIEFKENASEDQDTILNLYNICTDILENKDSIRYFKNFEPGSKLHDIVHTLLMYCNFIIDDNIIKFNLDNNIDYNVIKNRLNIIKSLHQRNLQQLINIINTTNTTTGNTTTTSTKQDTNKPDDVQDNGLENELVDNVVDVVKRKKLKRVKVSRRKGVQTSEDLVNEELINKFKNFQRVSSEIQALHQNSQALVQNNKLVNRLSLEKFQHLVSSLTSR